MARRSASRWGWPAWACLESLLASGPASSVFLGMSAAQLDFRLDGRVLAFAVGLNVLSVVAFGPAPAIRGSRVSLSSAMAGRSLAEDNAGVGARRALATLQVALSVVLLVAASLFIRTVRHLRTEDLGADRTHLLLVWTLPGQTGLRGALLRALIDRVHDRLTSRPGIERVSESGTGLLAGTSGGRSESLAAGWRA